MENLQETIQKIRFIHDNYLSGIANSTVIVPKLKDIILQCMRTFNTTNNNSLFEKNKKIAEKNFTEYFNIRPQEAIAAQESIEYIDLTSLILTCYNLTFYEFHEFHEKKDDPDSIRLDDGEIVDDNVQNFIILYIDIYKTIEGYRNIQRLNDAQICSKLRDDYNAINCTTYDKFYNMSKRIINAIFFGNRQQIGGNKWKNKYLKYKKKYLNMKNQKGGAPLENMTPLENMPQLCFGTAQVNLEKALRVALEIGYRHIDGAEDYKYIHEDIDYKRVIYECIKRIPRNELWITWKSDVISLDNITKICEELKCGYIDLFLFHHSCGDDEGFSELKDAQKENKIRYYGVSNCEDISIINNLKTQHNIFANQIQARPPKGRVLGREIFNPPNFIDECNKIGVNIMLYSTISGILTSSDFSISPIRKYISDINKYYIQKYINKKKNVLMVSSINLESLQKNFDYIKEEESLLSDGQMNTIQNDLEKMTLNYM